MDACTLIQVCRSMYQQWHAILLQAAELAQLAAKNVSTKVRLVSAASAGYITIILPALQRSEILKT